MPSKQFFFGGQPSFSAHEAEADEMPFRVQKRDVFPEINAYLESQAAGEKRFPPLDYAILHLPDHASKADLQVLMKSLLQLIGENIGLTRFDACCERLVSSSIKIHQEMGPASKNAISLASSNSSRHRTHIVLKLGGRPFCVWEMKLPVLFRKNMNDGHPDLAAIISDSLQHWDSPNHLVHGVLQLSKYFLKLDLGFGVLSSADLSYLVRRDGDTLSISDSIQWEDTRLIGAFAYLIHMASLAEPNQFKKEGAHKLTSHCCFLLMVNLYILFLLFVGAQVLKCSCVDDQGAHGAFFCVESTSGSDMGDASAQLWGDDSDGGGGSGAGDVSETGTIGLQ